MDLRRESYGVADKHSAPSTGAADAGSIGVRAEWREVER